MPQPRVPPEIRFWAKVDKSAGPTKCWPWLAAKTFGYGRFGVQAGNVVMAHRWAYEHLVGPIPEGLQIDHLCRNRGCINPQHMEPVTIAVNVLRGEGPSAQESRQIICRKGHPLEGTPGKRRCRICYREWCRNNWPRKYLNQKRRKADADSKQA